MTRRFKISFEFGKVVAISTGAPMGIYLRSMAMDRSAMIGTPWAPMGPAKPLSSSLKKTKLGFLSKKAFNFFLFLLAHALMLCIDAVSFVNSPALIKALPIDR